MHATSVTLSRSSGRLVALVGILAGAVLGLHVLDHHAVAGHAGTGAAHSSPTMLAGDGHVTDEAAAAGPADEADGHGMAILCLGLLLLAAAALLRSRRGIHQGPARHHVPRRAVALWHGLTRPPRPPSLIALGISRT